MFVTVFCFGRLFEAFSLFLLNDFVKVLSAASSPKTRKSLLSSALDSDSGIYEKKLSLVAEFWELTSEGMGSRDYVKHLSQRTANSTLLHTHDRGCI